MMKQIVLGQFSLASVFSGGGAVVPDFPTPLFFNETRQRPILLITPMKMLRVLLGVSPMRLERARWSRLFDFENGWEMGNVFSFDKMFHRSWKVLIND